jgi:glycosyltransferase involved in cell wall biosynthesis
MEHSKQPLISVIIPAYNYGKFLSQCFDSVLNQTYQNWECLLIDNGSTDDTKQITENYSQKDKRIHYYSQSNNSGPTIARNYGLKKAKGEIIQFLDADDLIEDQKFEKQVALLNAHPDYDIVYSGVKYFKSADPSKLYNDIGLGESKPWMLNLSGTGEKMISALLKGNIMVINSPLVRSSLFEKYGNMDEQLFYNEDWELWARFAINNATFCFDERPSTQALVRVHPASYSKDMFKMYLFGLIACLKINKRVSGYKYKKIMIPKINYHKKILDKELIKLLSSDKQKAIERTKTIYKETGVLRYAVYTTMFKYLPGWIPYLYSKFIFFINKLKNVIIYA